MRIRTQIDVAKARPGRHSDALTTGLYLIVGAEGRTRRWAFRYTKPDRGRVSEVGLGSADLWTLAEVREMAQENRKRVRLGEDPVKTKRDSRRGRITFAELATEYIVNHETGWRSAGHANAIRLQLQVHAQALGRLPVASITANDVEAAIRPLWNRAPVQGRRTLAAIAKVFGLARSKGLRPDNPAEWKDIQQHRFARSNGSKHYAAFDYEQMPAFIQELRRAQQREDALSPYVIEFLILAACRGGEVCGMQWAEVDFAAKVWTVPGVRTKSGREHRVPLSERMLEFLQRQREITDGEYVWPGRKEKPISTKAIYLFLTQRMGEPVTVHGFRASFASWAGNETNTDRVTCELALGHRSGNAVELAYRRGVELEKRRALMEAWAEFCGC